MTIKKLTLIALILATVSDAALADYQHRHHRKRTYKGETSYMIAPPAVIEQSPHFSFGGGVYAGLDLGLRTNYSSTPNAYKGVDGTLFGGFGYLAMNGLYIAEEVFVGDGFQLQNYVDKSSNNPGVKTSWSVGLSILPGYLILDNVLAYGRLGVVKSYFTNAGGNANGGQVGLGAQIALTQNWDLRGEYIYSFYSAVYSSSCTTNKNAAVKADQYNVGFVYKF